MRHSPHCSRPPLGRRRPTPQRRRGIANTARRRCRRPLLPCPAMSSNRYRLSRQYRQSGSECIPNPPSRGSTRDVGNPKFKVKHLRTANTVVLWLLQRGLESPRPDVGGPMSTDTEIAAPRKKPARRRTLYRGDPGMWSWVLHRITGATIFFFLFVHVLDTALVRVSPEAYNEVVNTYKTPIIGLMEVGLVAAVLYHALNGIRVILIDFWQHGPRYQRLMLWGVAAIWLAVMIPALGVLGMHMAERFLCERRGRRITARVGLLPLRRRSTTGLRRFTIRARRVDREASPTSRSTPGCSC